jgi:hypothetical protein
VPTPAVGVRVRGTGIRVGSTSEGRGAFGDIARASRRERAVISSSMSLGRDEVRGRLNGEPDSVGVVGPVKEGCHSWGSSRQREGGR